MKKPVFLFCTVLLLASLFAREINPLYQLPNTQSSKDTDSSQTFVVGSDEGLYRLTSNNACFPLWTDGRVDQIIPITDANPVEGKVSEKYIIRTSMGIYYTNGLKNFELRSEGLPTFVIKKYDGETTTLEEQIHPLKDIAVNPLNNAEMVTATKDAVFLSRDYGKTWTSLGSRSVTTPGVKACAVATINGQCVVFMSHPLYGVAYIFPDDPKSKWTDLKTGFEIMKTLSNTDEVSDILCVAKKDMDGTVRTDVYFSQSFLPNIYELSWEEKKVNLIYKGKEPLESTDGLTYVDGALLWTTMEGFAAVDLNLMSSPGKPSEAANWDKAFANVPGMVNTAWIPSNRSGFSEGVLLSELWQLYPGTVNTRFANTADGKKSIYVSAYQCRNQEGIDKFKKIIKDNNLNSLVIDMKDDYGLLRYHTTDPFVAEKAKESGYAIDLENFVDTFKKEGVYLIARLVVFKDKNLASYGKEKYSVWDRTTNKSWLGIKGYDDIVNEDGSSGGKQAVYYDEKWVDPYCEYVWEYNVAIAQELVRRGFDEIQFDYIRFPTDGENLSSTKYRYQEKGMDKESALISFLSYARENIDAPIGIDIYGANGWYRSGTRTGQDAELMSEYVDVIGPMFYPSHFEQNFLEYAPAADRTYRIYYYGSFRNSVITRNRAIIRPWIQAFYLNVRYDRQYYDKDYVQKQVFGVRDSINQGYMYWNNSGNYDYISPDITDDQPFTGTCEESSLEYRKPVLGDKVKGHYVDDGVSVLDSIIKEDFEYYGDFVYTPFLKINQ